MEDDPPALGIVSTLQEIDVGCGQDESVCLSLSNQVVLSDPRDGIPNLAE